MNNAFRLLAASLLFAPVAFCQSSQETTSLQHQTFETNLAQGTTLRLHLNDGDFRVVGSNAEKIPVHVEGKNVEQAEKIKIRVIRSDGTVDLKPSHVEILRRLDGTATILYLFPSSVEISKRDGRVEFVAQIGRLFVSQFFDTGEMLHRGELEILLPSNASR